MIEYKNVVKEYPNGVLATDHISLKIEQGDFYQDDVSSRSSDFR